jgi:hypothetical protein
VAKPFELGKIGIQHGVDANTLGRGARKVLDRARYAVQCALIDGGIRRATFIIVNEAGRVYDGDHGVRAAIDKDIAVDVEVRPGDEPPAGPPAIGVMPFDH